MTTVRRVASPARAAETIQLGNRVKSFHRRGYRVSPIKRSLLKIQKDAARSYNQQSEKIFPETQF
nr:hypothetical protein [uncultured Roseococcus sp.]